MREFPSDSFTPAVKAVQPSQHRTTRRSMTMDLNKIDTAMVVIDP
jgi:hypothetical protein